MTYSAWSASSSQLTSRGRSPSARLRPEVLGVSFAGQGDHPVRGLQDRLRAAVVLLQRDDRRVGVMLGEIEDVADRGGAEGVDRLGVVADDRQPLALRRKRVKDVGLERVGVLILVDQHAIEQLADGVARPRAAALPDPRRRPAGRASRAAGRRSRARRRPLCGPRSRRRAASVRPANPCTKGNAREHVVELLPGVDAAAVDRHAGALLGEPLVGLGQVQARCERRSSDPRNRRGRGP